MKPAVAGCVSKLEITLVCTGDSIGACDSKTACNSALFPSSVTGGCGELAVVEGIGGRKQASLGVCRLVWDCTTSSVCPIRP